MNSLLKFSTDVVQKRGLVLILTKDRARKTKTDLIAKLILSGLLFLVSGDEWLPAFDLPRLVRRQTMEVRTVMNRLRSARVSTCYRLFDSLANIPSEGEPILVIDFLHTFYEPDIPSRTRFFRLRECCRELKRLAMYRPVIVMVQDGETEDYEKFIPALLPITDNILTLELEPEQTTQDVLF